MEPSYKKRKIHGEKPIFDWQSGIEKYLPEFLVRVENMVPNMIPELWELIFIYAHERMVHTNGIYVSCGVQPERSTALCRPVYSYWFNINSQQKISADYCHVNEGSNDKLKSIHLEIRNEQQRGALDVEIHPCDPSNPVGLFEIIMFDEYDETYGCISWCGRFLYFFRHSSSNCSFLHEFICFD